MYTFVPAPWTVELPCSVFYLSHPYPVPVNHTENAEDHEQAEWSVLNRIVAQHLPMENSLDLDSDAVFIAFLSIFANDSNNASLLA